MENYTNDLNVLNFESCTTIDRDFRSIMRWELTAYILDASFVI